MAKDIKGHCLSEHLQTKEKSYSQPSYEQQNTLKYSSVLIRMEDIFLVFQVLNKAIMFFFLCIVNKYLTPE